MTNFQSPGNGTNRLTALLTLGATFALAATITFGARRVLGRPLDAQPSATEVKLAHDEAIASMPRLPADTEDKLNAALYPEIAPLASVADPFSDRAGLNNSANPQMVTTKAAVGPTLPIVPLIPERAARLSQWQQSVRAAVSSGSALPPITNAYLISEVAPTGKFQIRGRDGAWLYIDAEKRTISANIGSQFYDGTLVGINSAGVQFRTAASQTKTVPWNRQEEYSSPVPTVPVNPASRAKPVSELRSPAPVDGNEYSDLQRAVQQRYAKRTAEGSKVAAVSSSKTATLSTEPDQLTASPLTAGQPAQSQPSPASTTETSDETKATKPINHHAVARNTFAGTEPVPDSNEPTAEPSPSPMPSPSPAQAKPAPSQALPETAKTSGTETSTKQKQGATAAPSPSTAVSASSDSAPAATPQRKPLCDPNYRGEKMGMVNESGRPLTLLTFVEMLNQKFDANIVLDYDVQETPVRLTITDPAPWTSILRTVLDLNDLDAVCLDGSIVQIAKRMKIAQIGDQRKRSAPIIREVFKLRYLQSSAGGRTTLAGQTEATNGATIQTLESTIRDILKAGGDARGDARQVPGRSELIVAATQQQMDEIRDIIARVDRPSYQVKISALVYTTNESRLKDIGSQLSLVVGNGANTNIIGGTTLPNVSNTAGSGSGSGTSSGQGVSGINPGGIPGLATGMRQPSNALGATTPLATFGASTLFGTAQFSYQLTLAQQSGAINIQSRPFGIVSDGDTFDLISGTQIPVITSTIAGGAALPTGNVQVLEASRIARIKPQVAEDEHGRPSFITLNIQLENNSVDTSLGTFNGVPGINRQSLQTVLRLKDGETVVIGGLAADQVSNSQSKVPGLGDIPAVGNLFKRKQKQENRDRLYFAIKVEVIPQDAAMPNFPAPVDATTAQPTPPAAQKPSPYEKKN